MEDKAYLAKLLVNPVVSTEIQTHVFVRAGTLEELKGKGRLLVHGPHRPILVIEEQDRVYALDNRCPHMGFPLDRGSVETDLPLASCAFRSCEWLHLRSLGGRCTDLPGRSARWGGMGQGGILPPGARRLLAAATTRGHGSQSWARHCKSIAGSTSGWSWPARHCAPGGSLRRPESGRMGHGNDHPNSPGQPPGYPAEGRDLLGIVPWCQSNRRRL